MTLIEIYVVIAIVIVAFTIISHFTSKLKYAVLFLVAMCISVVLVKIGVFLYTLYLMQ